MMSKFYSDCCSFPVHTGGDMSSLNMSTLRQRCQKAYWNYIDELMEVPDVKGFMHKNSVLRFIRLALPSESGIEVSDADREIILKEAHDDYIKLPEAYLNSEQTMELGRYVQSCVKGSDYSVAKKLIFKPHLEAHAGFTSLVMQSDLFLLSDRGTEVVKIVQGQGDPDQEDLWEVMLSMLLQHLMYHPETAKHSVVYGAYRPVKIFTGELRKSDLVEPPETTINRIVAHLFNEQPLCGSCRYVNCEERRKI